MVIDSSQRSGPPRNGWVRIAVSAPGSFEELDLDFEDVVREPGAFCIKCYDTAANPVYIRILPLILEQAVFGNVVYEDGIPPGTEMPPSPCT